MSRTLGRLVGGLTGTLGVPGTILLAAVAVALLAAWSDFNG